MLIQTNPRFQSVRGSLGLIILVSTLAILLPQVNVVKRADTTNPSLRGVRKVGVGPAGIVPALGVDGDRKSTRLNSSHLVISYAVFCLKKKKSTLHPMPRSTRHDT